MTYGPGDLSGEFVASRGTVRGGHRSRDGQWVRPVPPRGGAIPEERTWLKGQCIGLLDIVEMQLEAPAFDTRFQRENCRVRSWNWRLVGRATAADVLKYCTRPGQILHSAGKVVEPAHMERLPPEQWTSLELVRVKSVVFEPDPKKDHRWQARFSMGQLGPSYCLGMTDPEATLRLNGGEQITAECLLTVSLTEPIEFSQYDKPELCYKLVAGVIELDGGQ